MEAPERKKILELLLWITDHPLKISDFQQILGNDCPPPAELEEDIRNFGKELDAREAPMQLMEVAEGFQVSSRPVHAPWVRRLYKDKTSLRLSTSALETLSIVAYKQPMTRGEIEEIRGVEVTGVLETLLERKLLRIVGRKETLGRPLLYGTTPDFMRQFGLKSLEDLPKLEELMPPEDLPQSPETPEEVPPSQETPPETPASS